MCNENPMTCFQSNVIAPPELDKRMQIESNFLKYSPSPVEKSSFNEATCDNLSKKYTFSNIQFSGDLKHASSKNDPPPLLKSNVNVGNDVQLKEFSHSKSDLPFPTAKEKLSQKLIIKEEKQMIESTKIESSSTVNVSCTENLVKHKLTDKYKIDKHNSSKTTAIPIVDSTEVKHTISSMLKPDICSKQDNSTLCFSVSTEPFHVPDRATSQIDKLSISKKKTKTLMCRYQKLFQKRMWQSLMTNVVKLLKQSLKGQHYYC
ncbi:remodeling and spacing factor 1 [Caerostris extrusa]|uniref:Remodeling and spacing factor 1 n=1 Tax=Caerostris extrusa TaxID=172846 RepID=A0AAV4VV72_CAEEX|nr:remodeling and spacing factor 1 [Caerostris extrusa]